MKDGHERTVGVEIMRPRRSAAQGQNSGGTDPKIYAEAKASGTLNELPVNHSPQFAPVLHLTMETGVEALVVGALAWLGSDAK